MAFFGGGSKKQQEPSGIPSSQPIPVEEVTRMKQQGYSSNQITQQLQMKGYSAQQISSALSQASTMGTPQAPPPAPDTGANPYAAQATQYPSFEHQGTYEQPYQQEGYSADDERIEEIAEAIIDEKWQELVKDVKKVIDWKDSVDSRISHLDQQIKDLRSTMDNMHKAIFGKIADYDKSIIDVGTEIKAMERVFQKILPNLTESVNKLERLAKKK